MSFKEVEQVEFTINETITWGVKKDKYSGYSIPIVLDDETAEKVSDLSEKHSTKDPVYKKTLYLKLNELTEKQKEELFEKERQIIKVRFTLTGVYTKENRSFLKFKVTGLKRLEKPEPVVELAADDF